jgi:hypothetical protein
LTNGNKSSIISVVSKPTAKLVSKQLQKLKIVIPQGFEKRQLPSWCFLLSAFSSNDLIRAGVYPPDMPL